MDAMDTARAALDAAHLNDPAGPAGERQYADLIEAWITRLVSAPSPELQLAARAQHLERWAIPRADYPEGRGGYLRWRAAVHKRQGDRAQEILGAAGCDPALTARVAALVSKAAPRGDAEAQALEDAACLVFLETEFADFAAEYSREKTIDVLRKTWRKMSAGGHEAAAKLTLAPPLAALVAEAVA